MLLFLVLALLVNPAIATAQAENPGAVSQRDTTVTAGILHAEPSMVVLPDDAALGEFRQRFAGMLGFSTC